MAERVIGARVEFYNPSTGSLRYTVTRDVLFMEIEENGRDEADDAEIRIANYQGEHSNKFNEGDEVRVYVQHEGDATERHIWTGVVDTWRTERDGNNYAVIIVEAQDYVYTELVNTYVTDVYENVDAGAIVRSIVNQNAPNVDTSLVEDTGEVIDHITFSGITLLSAIRRLAEQGKGEWAGDAQKRLRFFLKGGKTDEALATAADVVRGSFRVEASMSGFGNVIKVRGGSKSVIDQWVSVANPTFTRVSSTVRLTRRVFVSKSTLARVDLWTNPGTLTGDLRVRVQAEAEDGSGPVAPDDPNADIVARTFAKEWLTVDGWTSFILPHNTVPAGGHVWLIIECPTPDLEQQVGVDASGKPLYQSYYPVKVIVERIDQPSINAYGRRELPPVQDQTIATDDEAILVADMALAKASTPQKMIEYEVQNYAVQKEATTNVIPDADFSEQTLQGPYRAANNGGVLSFVNDAAPEAGGKALKLAWDGATGNESVTYDHSGTNGKLADAAPGEVWTASVYAKAADTTSVGNLAQMFLFGLDSNLKYFSGSYKSVSHTLTDDWVRMEVTFTMPTGVTAVSCRVDIDDPGAVLYSGWQVEKQDHATAFVDGSRDDVSLPLVDLGERFHTSFPNDGIPTGTTYVLGKRVHVYDGDEGTYALMHEAREASRVERVEDLLMRVHERLNRVEASVMGSSEGEIVDMIRSAQDGFTVSVTTSRTVITAGTFKVGAARVGFCTVA